MRRKGKIILSVLLSFFILFIIINLPIVAYGYNTCTGQTEYESYMAYHYPCFPECTFCCATIDPVALSSVSLYAGETATNSLPATAKIIIVLNNPCVVAIHITSLSLDYYVPTINHWDNTSLPSSPSNLILFSNSAKYLGDNVLGPNRITTLTFYPESSTAEIIVKNQTYYFNINMSNGWSVSVSVTAG